MIEDRIAFVSATIIEGQPKKVGVVLKTRCKVKTQLTAEEQLIVVDCQRVTRWQARNRFIQAIGRHSDNIDSRQEIGQLPRLIGRIVPVQVEPGLLLSIGAGIRGLPIDIRRMATERNG